jgi:predicted metal-dependent RNase
MSKHDIKWNDMFNRLVQYKAEHGNCLVPQNYQADGRLGRWVHYQRVEFWMLKQRGSGKITQSRVDKLDSIGFEWDPQKSKWNSMFFRLVDFKSEHGHCMVPKGHKEDTELANWVRNQRLEHQNLEKNRKGRMTIERKERLESIGFQWNARP